MAADEREISSLSRAGSGVDEPLIVPTREGYDLWSQTYDDEDNPLIALEEAAFERLLGEVRGLTIADIGCGTGRHALAMAQSGAHVVALDFSLGMLAKARAKGGAPTLRLVQHDLAVGLPFKSRSMDRVVCCLVLEHVTDLGGALGEMSRICRLDRFVLVSDLHPAMRLLNVQAQFTDPATGRKTRPAGAYHQISDYVMAATGAGLCVDHMSEHAVDDALVTRTPRARKHLGWPLLLLMRLTPTVR